ncbi:hypothetical protein GCM10027160_24050 [Streptomyces calidiresistens]|uniref:Uncharacterized protein n=1 Tax=Streptomyces calidiresistens TaxID=1485586 RepID=A0A7W3T8R8_9ACTN|nr:hypothetical protein [Streptomyces calidiresistens]MBB0233020.1 hypothetical protein [Streptomyces calidiresistens]
MSNDHLWEHHTPTTISHITVDPLGLINLHVENRTHAIDINLTDGPAERLATNLTSYFATADHFADHDRAAIATAIGETPTVPEIEITGTEGDRINLFPRPGTPTDAVLQANGTDQDDRDGRRAEIVVTLIPAARYRLGHALLAGLPQQPTPAENTTQPQPTPAEPERPTAHARALAAVLTRLEADAVARDNHADRGRRNNTPHRTDDYAYARGLRAAARLIRHELDH